MREVTIRTLLRDFKSVLPIPEDGIRVTRRDGEDFYIYPNVRQKEVDVRQDVRQTSTMPVENKVEEYVGEVWEYGTPRVENTFCAMHFEPVKGKKYDCVRLNYEDAYGNLIKKGQLYCPQCLAQLKSNIKHDGGTITYQP